jgi:hypothetical protein
MKKEYLYFFLILSFWNTVSAQTIRTYNAIHVGSSFSSKGISNRIGLGEFLQLSSKVPLRFLTGINLSLNTAYQGAEFEAINQKIKTLARFSSLGFQAPVGIEIFKGGLGLGASYDIFSIHFKKEINAEKVKLEDKETFDGKTFTTPFSAKNNLSKKIYLNYTFNDSFTLNLGMETQNFSYLRYTDNVKGAAYKFSPQHFYIGFRSNLAK